MFIRSLSILLLWSYSVPAAAQWAASLADIQNADSQQLYVAEFQFDQPVSIGTVRKISSDLNIPRVLAYVTYGSMAEEQNQLVIVGLGAMYASVKARQHTECRALTSVNFGQGNELRGLPIDEWAVSKINVYASAYIMRELLAGIRLPPAVLVGANVAKPEHLHKLAEYTRNEVAQPMSPQKNISLPAFCSQFIAPSDTPILTGGFPPDFQPPKAGRQEGFREYAFRLLARLSSEDAVTVQLKLNVATTVEGLAALVRQYNIKGMTAEMVPEHSSKQVISMAELSTFGAPEKAQTHRVRCQMRLGNRQPQASSEWYADWISISLNAEDAVSFMSYPNLAQARITGSHAAAELLRLEGYFDTLAERTYELPRSIEIPDDCGDFYVHNEQNETGSVGIVPVPDD